MKILDRYILVSYLKTFFSVFIILMLIFILQSVWLYISELAGKDLEIDIIIKFLLYVSPRMVVMALPLTILLTSIMVFGRFAENYEFAAMKSTGISLQRAMKSLSVFIVLLSVVTFFFANNVIPAAEYNFYNLRKNIAKKKPTMAIAKGQFNEIGDLINIKIKDKSGDKGQFLEEVIVHKKRKKSDGNHTVIIAESGELRSSDDSDILELILYNGNYHDDLQPKDYVKRTKNLPHVKSTFKKNTFLIDLSQINQVDFQQKDVTTRHSMLTINELDYTIDSLKNNKKMRAEKLALDLYSRTSAPTINTSITPEVSDSLKTIPNEFINMFDDRQKAQLLELARNSVNSTLQILSAKKRSKVTEDKDLNKHIISFYDKFSLGIACIILFFIGAPLGALIKKGGIGLPIVIAIILFLTYHFIGIFAKNSAEDNSINPILAAWLSTLIMLPLSIYLTDRATKDRPLLELDTIFEPIKRLLVKEVAIAPIDTTVFLEESSKDYKSIQEYSDKKLIDIVKNYRQYELDERYRNSALNLLKSRGITEQELRFGGNLVNENYENALRYKASYDENSNLSLKLYLLMVVPLISGLVLNNNGFPSLGKVLIGLGIFFGVFFLITLTKTYQNQTNFNKLLGKNTTANIFTVILVGIPLYFLYFNFYKKKMKEDLKQVR